MEIKLFDDVIYFENGYKYKIDIYPDSQRNISMTDEQFLCTGLIKNNVEIDIVTSITSFQHLESLLCLFEFLDRNSFFIDTVDFLYMIGLRSDRSFSHHGISYFSKIIAPILNSLRCRSIIFRWPHNSQMSNSLIKESCYIADYPDTLDYYVESSLAIGADENPHREFDANFVKKRISNTIVIDRLNIIKPISINPISMLGDIYIVDDLCDGGRTFIECAKYIKNDLPTFSGRINLFIYHAIFSNKENIKLLSELYDEVHFTNSYKADYGILPSNFIMHDIRGI